MSLPDPVKSLRIVHCFRSPVGGIFRHVRDLAELQHAAGHKVGIVCDSSTGGEFEDRLFAAMQHRLALGLVRLPMHREMGIGDVVTAARVFSAIKGMRPAIVHAHSAKAGFYGRIFGTLLGLSGSGAARLYSPHGGSLHYDPSSRTGRIVFPLERLMTRLTDHLVFVSQFERNTFIKKVGEPHCPSTVVYNGLWDRDFETVVPDGDARDFLYIGMMRDLKGPDIFIDAIARASAETGRALNAVMVGDGAQRDFYIEKVRQAGLAERITFRMPMPAREAFRLARTVVVPSRAEALPYIVLEALASGKPMIATRVGGIPEIFGPQSPALINPDVGELARKMADVLNDEKRFAASMPAKEKLREQFNVTAMAGSVERIYMEALEGKG